MDYSLGINNKTLKRNVGDVLQQYDKDGNGLNNSEIKNLVKGSVSIFGKPFVKDKTIQKIQGQFDANKDGIVSEKEIDAFLKNKYNMKLEDAKKMNVKNLLIPFKLKMKPEKRQKRNKIQITKFP